jgi:predicted phage terminase large subunit-like protein
VGSRIDNKAEDAIVVVMQRLHAEDLSGRLLDLGGWDQLLIPAIAETEQLYEVGPGRRLRRRVGDVLDPVREPKEILDQIRHELGSATFEAQYQQQPLPEKGGLVEWEWFQTYKGSPPLSEIDWLVISWDTAMKDKEVSDYSVGIVALVKPNNQVYILDLIRQRMDFPTLRRRIVAEAEKCRNGLHLIEDAGSGTSLLQDLRDQVRLIGIRPDGDKVVRFQRVTPLIEAGQLHLPDRATWLDAFKREVLSFPKSSNDDQVDALSQLLNWMRARYRGPLQSSYHTR